MYLTWKRSAKAENLGVKKAVVIDAKDTFVNDYCWPALQADAVYEGSIR
jgi:argininosuccinate synthase